MRLDEGELTLPLTLGEPRLGSPGVRRGEPQATPLALRFPLTPSFWVGSAPGEHSGSLTGNPLWCLAFGGVYRRIPVDTPEGSDAPRCALNRTQRQRRCWVRSCRKEFLGANGA
jgi:hypothetical protein